MQSFSTFIPPERTLMGPGPSDVNPRILNAMARPTLGHLDPLFIELMDQTKQLLQYAFKTENTYYAYFCSGLSRNGHVLLIL